ncbi:MAG: LD-carboxypeptidase [Bacteroidales bacterium]|nr:LD-carboxypeptidase [Bacteroidales bacterium]
MTHPFTVPPALQPGDTIAIVSPATIVRSEYIDGAAEMLKAKGFKVRIMPHAKGPAAGSYAAEDAARAADLKSAWEDPIVKAILCARGGYGCNHLLYEIDPKIVKENPKWLIGFSDVSALHAFSARAGVVSLHAPMAKHLATLPPDHYCTQALIEILTDGLPMEYNVPAHPMNRMGEATGLLIGGNLAVFNGLGSTLFDPFAIARRAGAARPILFIEDIAEQIYAVERMLIRMDLSGDLKGLGGIIVGHFTDYRPDRNFQDMESMISALIERFGLKIPVAFGFPAGHTDDNLPLALGSQATLRVTPQSVTLRMSSHIQ